MEQIIYESQELELKNDDHILNHAHRSFQPIYDGEKRKDKEISRKQTEQDQASNMYEIRVYEPEK